MVHTIVGVPDPELTESSEAAAKLEEARQRSAEIIEKMKATAEKGEALHDAVTKELERIRSGGSGESTEPVLGAERPGDGARVAR